MQSQIVVPLDGTPGAERAICVAVALAAATGSTMTLVRAINPVLLYHPTCHVELVPIVYDRFRDEWQVAGDYLRKLAGRLSERGISVRAIVEYGDPASTVVAQARANTPSTIVMATNRRSGIDRWLVGSRAEQVLRHTTVPVLLVSGASRQLDLAAPWTMRTIVAVLDGAGPDTATLTEAQRLASLSGATVVLTTLEEVLRQPGTGRQVWRRGQTRAVGAPAADGRPNLAQTPVTDTSTLDALVDGCVRESPDLVILPNYRRGLMRRPALSRALIPLVHEAGIPVLVMPEPVAATAPESGGAHLLQPLSRLVSGQRSSGRMVSPGRSP